MASTYKLKLHVPKEVSCTFADQLHSVDRESFLSWLWTLPGLVGIHEGTLLSDQAVEYGFETDSWTVDSAEAPRERDWVNHQKVVEAELFFATHDEAIRGVTLLSQVTQLESSPIIEQKDQDWDAQWRASFLNAGEGVVIPPLWRIVPPWKKRDSSAICLEEKWIKINPGAGFGTGTHETTQLCLEALGQIVLRQSISGKRALDFGSGSGILSVGLALCGAKVDAIEIDPLAIENARENANLNEVSHSITFAQALSSDAISYDLIIANILKPVLLEYSELLTRRLSQQGCLILSGLIEKDVEPVLNCYRQYLRETSDQVLSKGEWRAIVFNKRKN